MARREYSDSEKAEALAVLAANGGNLSRTEQDTGIPRRNLARWQKGEAANPAVGDLAQVKKGELSDHLEALAYTLIEAMPGKVVGASLRDAATTLGIAVDKMQLLRGEPTAINAQTLNDEQRADRIAALFEAARTRRAGQPHLRAVG